MSSSTTARVGFYENDPTKPARLNTELYNCLANFPSTLITILAQYCGPTLIEWSTLEPFDERILCIKLTNLPIEIAFIHNLKLPGDVSILYRLHTPDTRDVVNYRCTVWNMNQSDANALISHQVTVLLGTTIMDRIQNDVELQLLDRCVRFYLSRLYMLNEGYSIAIWNDDDADDGDDDDDDDDDDPVVMRTSASCFASNSCFTFQPSQCSEFVSGIVDMKNCPVHVRTIFQDPLINMFLTKLPRAKRVGRDMTFLFSYIFNIFYALLSDQCRIIGLMNSVKSSTKYNSIEEHKHRIWDLATNFH